jgi:hypothetical protein
MAINTITDRFDQDDFKIQICVEQMLLKACQGQFNEAVIQMGKILPIFPDDFDKNLLEQDLKQLAGQELKNIEDIVTLKDLFQRRDIQKMIGQATKAVQILLVSPATNAISERSFSKLKLLKNHLRSTFGDLRLSHLMACSIHKEITMEIPLELLANRFVADVTNRISAFGHF